MEPSDADSTQEAVPLDESLQEQLHELARLVGGLLARKHLRRPAVAGPRECREDERPGAGQDTV